jgi:hypothetical protein
MAVIIEAKKQSKGEAQIPQRIGLRLHRVQETIQIYGEYRQVATQLPRNAPNLNNLKEKRKFSEVEYFLISQSSLLAWNLQVNVGWGEEIGRLSER